MQPVRIPADSQETMRTLFVVLALTTLLTQPAPELVLSVGHAGAPRHAAFLDGYLATASSSGVALIDLSSGLTISHLPQGSLITALEANPRGDLLAVGTCGDGIQIWDVRSRMRRLRITLQHECPDDLAFSPDGRLLATGVYGCCRGRRLEVWDVTSGTLVREINGPRGLRNVVFSGDGSWLAGVDDEGEATIFEWPSTRPLQVLKGLDHAGLTDAAMIASRDGRYIGWLAAGALRIWEVSTAREVPLPGARDVYIHDKPLDGPERRWTEVRVMAAAPRFIDDGRLAFVHDDRLVLIALSSGETQSVPLPGPGIDSRGHIGLAQSQDWLAMRHDGRMLAGSLQSDTVLWDRGAGFRVLTAPALIAPTSLRWSRTGLIAYADSGSGLRVWNDHQGETVAFGHEADDAIAISVRPDGQRIAIAGYSSVGVFDVNSRRLLSSFALEPGGLTAVAFSPDGSRLAFAAADALTLFDEMLRVQRIVIPLEQYSGAEHIAFSPDGRWIAAATSVPPTLRVWPVAGTDPPIALDTHRLTYGPQPPAFSSDSRRVASFTRGSTLTVWRQVIGVPNAHGRFLTPDGRSPSLQQARVSQSLAIAKPLCGMRTAAKRS
jgi:WD40 repeat protein